MDTAIEVALGGHLQDIVVERWSDAEAAIAQALSAATCRSASMASTSAATPNDDNKKAPTSFEVGAFNFKSGSVLLSHRATL